jgi:beta-fructofuranosidase
MQKKSYPDSLVPKYTFSEENQELLLKEDPIIKRMKKARNDKSKDLFRPHFHFVNPENTLNDPNGLCFWNGAWHLFYQVRPPEDQRLHWGHAVSSDLVHWRDLPYALYPGPENGCYSGTVLIENERAIAIYHGTEIGNMVAIAKDPLLLNWEKIEANPVIPFGNESEPPKPYGIFDPCIW